MVGVAKHRRAWVAVAVAVMLVAACSSGSDAPVARHASTTTSTTRPERLPAADPDLSAYRLLDAAGYEQALGTGVIGVEDDGGVPTTDGSTGHVSGATVRTKGGAEISVTLDSFASTAAAESVYRKLATKDSSPSPGLLYARKGAQLLQIKATSDAVARKVARPLTKAMTGEPSTEIALALPAGAVDPCVLTGSQLANALHLHDRVDTAYEITDGPALQCDYAVPGKEPLQVVVVTDAQARRALDRSNAVARLLADAQAAAFEGRVVQIHGAGIDGYTVGPLRGHAPGIDVELVIRGRGDRGDLLLRVRERSRDEVLDAAGCRSVFRRLLGAVLHGAPPDDAVLGALDGHCEKAQ